MIKKRRHHFQKRRRGGGDGGDCDTPQTSPLKCLPAISIEGKKSLFTKLLGVQKRHLKRIVMATDFSALSAFIHLAAVAFAWA